MHYWDLSRLTEKLKAQKMNKTQDFTLPLHSGLFMTLGNDNAGLVARRDTWRRPKQKVLVAIRDDAIRQGVINYLRQNNYWAIGSCDGPSTLDKTREYLIDIILADTGIAGETAETERILREIREIDEFIQPVLIYRPQIGHIRLAANSSKFRGIPLGDIGKMLSARNLTGLEGIIDEAVQQTKIFRRDFYTTRIANHWREIEGEKTEAGRDLGKLLETIFFRSPQNYGNVVRYSEDSIEGVLAMSYTSIDVRKDYAPVEPEKDYKQLSPIAYIIKRLPSVEYFEKYSQIVLEHPEFPLAQPKTYHVVANSDRHNAGSPQIVLGVFKMFLAPNGTKIMSKLNYQNPIERQIIDGYIAHSIKTSHQWAEAMRPEVDFSPESLQSASRDYVGKVAEVLRYAETSMLVDFSPSEKTEFLDYMAEKFSEIAEEARFFGAITDNNLANSGLEIFQMEPTADKIRDELAWYASIGDGIKATYRMWDVNLDLNAEGKIRPRLMAEELRPIDSYEANLPESEKMKHIVDYVKSLPHVSRGEAENSETRAETNEQFNEQLKHVILVLAYKHLRIGYFNAARYASQNESDYEHFRIENREEYIRKRYGCYEKKRYHFSHSEKYFAVYALIDSDPQYMGRDSDENAKLVSDLMVDYISGNLYRLNDGTIKMPISYRVIHKIATNVPY